MYDAGSALRGAGQASADQVQAWFAAHNVASPAGLGAAILAECQPYSLDSDLVAAQIAHETGYWTSSYAVERCNPAGLGAVNNNPDLALSFPTPRAGIHAMVAHLLTYILGSSNPIRADDPRYADWSAAGSYTTQILSGLDGHWAWPGQGYGARIAQLANDLTNSAHSALSAPGAPTPGGSVSTILGIPLVFIAAAPQNYDKGPASKDLIIIHRMQGTAPSAIAWFQNPSAGASTQYALDPDAGRIVQLIADTDIAWGCGNYSYNKRAIQLEIPGNVGDAWSEPMLDYAARLVALKAQQFQIPLRFVDLAGNRANQSGITGHQYIPDPNNPSLGGGVDHHSDPGDNFPWADFLQRVQALLTQADPQVIRYPNNPYEAQLGGPIVVGGGFKNCLKQIPGDYQLPLLGYPIANETQASIAGATRTIQRFERGVLCWYPAGSPDGVPAGSPWEVRVLTRAEQAQVG